MLKRFAHIIRLCAAGIPQLQDMVSSLTFLMNMRIPFRRLDVRTLKPQLFSMASSQIVQRLFSFNRPREMLVIRAGIRLLPSLISIRGSLTLI